MAEFNEISEDENINSTANRFNSISAESTLNTTKKAAFVLAGFGLNRLINKGINEIVGSDDDAVEATGALGLPVFTNLVIENKSFIFYNEKENREEVIFQEGLTLNAVLMTVSMTKNIIKTTVQGRNGTVKEYSNDGDFEIDVKGVIVGEGQNEYPSLDVEALVRLCTVPDTLDINSDFLTRFSSITPSGIEGISQVVIEGFTLPQREGFRNAQLFQFKMLSNTPIQLTI